jgi:protein TonB
MRKTENANLENKKIIFFEIGVSIALIIMLFAFEYKSYGPTDYEINRREVVDIPEDIVPITEQKVKPPPPPPPKQVTKITIVEDDVDVDDEIDIDVEADDNTEMEEYIPLEDEDEEIDEQEIFSIVESMPEFPGGVKELYKFLNDNIRYPMMAKEANIQGVVYVNFLIESDGNITNIIVLRGIGGGCDDEAIRIVEIMPKWTPGKQRGKPVRVNFNLPVKFTLL